MANEGSILSGIAEGGDNIASSGIRTGDSIQSSNNPYLQAYDTMQLTLDKYMADSIDGSTRLIGAPHQFLAHNDNRYGNSKMGRMYAEKIIMEAPTIYLKPGGTLFLPGKNSKEKQDFINTITDVYREPDRNDILRKLNNEYGDDMIQYFGIKPDYSGFMNKVNMLCRMLAAFLGISNLKVPWIKGNSTFATYDWRTYRMKQQYGDLEINMSNPSVFGAFKNFIDKVKGSFEHDYEYIQFYITPDGSYNESFSNSTTSSVLENMTSQLEGIAKELQVVSAISGAGLDEALGKSVSTLDSYIGENMNGAIGKMLKRVTGAANQVLRGGNFILPEIWNSSSRDTSLSFKIHLVTPYGNKLAWYINVGVPMMFAIAMVLPIQQTANVVSSPYLFQVCSPGWFNSSMCIVDSLSIEKASDGTWNKAGLPNDVTISVGMKDLYSSLALPKSNSPSEFMANTGMLEFLMVNAGVDITNQSIGTKWKVWKALFQNRMSSLVQKNAYDLSMLFKHHASGMFKILK